MEKNELIINIGNLMNEGSEEKDHIEKAIKMLDDYVSNITTRLRSDFENEKKRIEKNNEKSENQIRFKTLSEFTEILDDFQFFKDVIDDSECESVKTGFDLLNREINKFLNKSKIEVIDTNGLFNSDLHECVSLMDKGLEKGKIVETVSRGYKVDNQIIKYPKVIVQP